jgi:hypothetical protein
MELNEYILAKAIENDICKPWAEKISKAKDADELMQMYVDGIDFCLSNNFPSNEDLKTLAGDIINQYGIYIDQQFKLLDRPFIVALANTIGDSHYSGYSVSRLFAKHQSTVRVTARDNAFLLIDCFDNSFIDITASGNANIAVHVYGKATVVHTQTGNAMVKIVNKLKDTY